MRPCCRPIGSNIRGSRQQTQPLAGLAAVSARCSNPVVHRPSGSECKVLQQTKSLAGLEAASITRKVFAGLA
eukprot:4082534-Lingulodinium_polyedra.AAC.1